MKTYDLDGAIIIESEVRVNQPFQDTPDDPSEIDGVTIDIYYQGSKVVDGVSMTKDDTGQYYYTWDTSDEESGDYGIKITVEKDGAEGVENEVIRLKEGDLIG